MIFKCSPVLDNGSNFKNLDEKWNGKSTRRLAKAEKLGKLTRIQWCIQFLGHPKKMFLFPSPDRPIFSKSKKKKKPSLLVKKASTLIYKPMILFY